MTYNYEEVYNCLDEGKVADKFPDFKQYKKHFKEAEKKYPRLKISLDKKDVVGLIDDVGLLSVDKMSTPIERLLYAFLWKQGDLSKVKLIVEGISESKLLTDKRSGLVFYQFGRHLSDNEEPIIDINVLRAYAVYSDTVGGLTQSGISTSQKGVDLVQRYITWFKRVTKRPDDRFIADRIMFAIGKHLNSKKSK